MGELLHKADAADRTVKPQTDTVNSDASESQLASGLDAARIDAHGPAQKVEKGDYRLGTAGGADAGDGFSIVSAPAGEAGSKVDVLPSLKRTDFNADKVADQIEEACNGGLTGLGTDEEAILNALKGLSPDQIAEVDKSFADRHGVKYAAQGQRWGLREEFRDELGGAALATGLAILDAKNEIPPQLAQSGESLLKEGSGLKAGETNRVTLADGRKYDIYVPNNAQKPLPVMMLLHGASNGHDMSNMRIMEKESGMNHVAEQYGFAVVYPYNEPRNVTAMGIEKQPAVWNLQGNKNFMETDPKYDDAVYLDRVIADVGARVSVDSTRVGIAGMSDGGRAAQQYALDHPGKVSALVAMNGTWMDGNKKPEAGAGLPTMIINSEDDYMLPHDQGEGTLWKQGRGMMSMIAAPWIPGTADSRPNQQLAVFKEANQCQGEPTTTKLHDLVITQFDKDNCARGEVRQYLVEGANHAWHDWRNEGGWYVVGMPDRNQRMSEETAKFILQNPLKRSF